jgi:hypothetical protein
LGEFEAGLRFCKELTTLDTALPRLKLPTPAVEAGERGRIALERQLFAGRIAVVTGEDWLIQDTCEQDGGGRKGAGHGRSLGGDLGFK